MSEREKISLGFFGLGDMGGLMVRNLLAGGYEFVVCDLDEKRVAACANAAAEVGAEGQEVKFREFP